MNSKKTYSRTSRFIRYLRNHVIALEVFCTLIIIFVGMRCIHLFEGFSLYNSFYYIIITIAGVGYGDITPITPRGKGVAMIIASLGMPLYLITATIIATNTVNRIKNIKKSSEKVIISKVKAIIIKEKSVLLLKTEHPEYTIRDLPGGTIQYGEKAEHALLRRVIQEIQMSVTITKSIGIWRWINKHTGALSLCHTYLAHLTSKDTVNTGAVKKEQQKAVIVRVPIKEIVENKIDIENDSLTELIKEQYAHIL